MTNAEQIKGLEQQLADSKELVGRRDLAIKLAANKNFRELILEDFCLKEAARLVQQSSDPALTAEQKADALSMAQASGHLKRYLSMMITMGNRASTDVVAIEEALDEIRASGDNEGVAIKEGDLA